MKLSSCLAVLTTASLACGQTFVSSPPGRLNIEGGTYCNWFGSFAAGRHMILDGNLGQRAGTYKGIEFRQDSRNHSDIGRAWTRVTLDLSTGSVANVSPTFSSNQTSAPTRVFSAAVSWPTLNGPPPATPAFWGGPLGAFRIPFQTNWNHSGNADICLDFDFTGGTLVGSNLWTTGSRSVSYYLDSYRPPPTVVRGNATGYGGSGTTGGCVNTGRRFAGTTSLETETNTFNSTSAAIIRSADTPGPVLQVLSLGGFQNGVPFPGVTCNGLHLDLTLPHVLFLAQATSFGWTYTVVRRQAYAPALTGLDLWAQCAWADSTTGATLLTNASRNRIPVLPVAVRRATVFQGDPALKASSGIVRTLPTYSPVYRVTL